MIISKVKTKTRKQRSNFFFYELKLNCLKFVLYNNFFNSLCVSQFRRDLFFLLQYKPLKYYLKYNVVNYCILTGKKRSVFRKFSMSRHSLKKLGSFGLLYGLTKSSW